MVFFMGFGALHRDLDSDTLQVFLLRLDRGGFGLLCMCFFRIRSHAKSRTPCKFLFGLALSRTNMAIHLAQMIRTNAHGLFSGNCIHLAQIIRTHAHEPTLTQLCFFWELYPPGPNEKNPRPRAFFGELYPPGPNDKNPRPQAFSGNPRSRAFYRSERAGGSRLCS